MDQETNYQRLVQQEQSLKLQLLEMNKEKDTAADELKNAVMQKEMLEQQLMELRTQSKDENDSSTSPEIIPSNFSFGSSDIQVQFVYTYNIILRTYVTGFVKSGLPIFRLYRNTTPPTALKFLGNLYG